MKAPLLTASALLAIVLFMVLSLVTARSDTTFTQTQLAAAQTAEIRG